MKAEVVVADWPRSGGVPGIVVVIERHRVTFGRPV